MAKKSTWSRTVASYVLPRAFVPQTRAALENLGYRIIPSATRGRYLDDSREPDVRIIDERLLGRVPPQDYLPRTPIILLTGVKPLDARDSRIIGSAPRPATLEFLYPLLQEALEDTPRSTARTPTELAARCTRADRRWVGAVVSLSEQGCLFRTSEPLADGLELSMLFPLPLGRMVSTRARVLHRQGESVGMEFVDVSGPDRMAVGKYVKHRLATHLRE
jgi:hypothetical protein